MTALKEVVNGPTRDIKDKEQEDLDNKDKSVVKDVVGAEKSAKVPFGQAKDLEKINED